jgi:peptide/nickel transport system permease protein
MLTFASHFKTMLALFRYLAIRALGIFATMFFGIFLTVVLMNQSSFIDEAVYQEASKAALSYVPSTYDPTQFKSQQERNQLIDGITNELANRAGLNLPYWPRQLRWTWSILTFHWPDVKGVMTTEKETFRTFSAQNVPFDIRYKSWVIVAQHFPNTLLIMGVAYAIIFSFGIPFALRLSRRYNHWLDRVTTSLAPSSSIPSWAYGILLVSIFAIQLHWLPYNGKYDLLPPDSRWGYIPIVGRHMVMPVTAVILSMFFQIVYSWRTYFMLYTQEDYVELAIAKGVPARTLELRYILRPTLPYILTSFALTLTSFWQMTTALEYFFNWPGIGWMYFKSLLTNDLIVSLGTVVIFAYAIGAVTLILDLLYIAIDPRLRFNITSQPSFQSRLASTRKGWHRHTFNSKIRFRLPRVDPREWVHSLREWYALSARPFLRELRHYPAALISLTVIGVFSVASVYAMIVFPYNELDHLWNPGLSQYITRPALAGPLWYNWFLKHDLPENIILDTRTTPALKKSVATAIGNSITITYTFTVPDGDFPKDILLYFHSKYDEKTPFTSVTWITPDHREFKLKNASVLNGVSYNFSKNIPRHYLDDRYHSEQSIVSKGGEPAHKALFTDPISVELKPVPGTYMLRLDAVTFEPDSDVDVEFILLGQVYGWAGTDHLRRELSIGLLWGLPIALSIGLLGALTTSLLAMLIAASGAWVGGWLDTLIQRITEANMILPILAVGVLLSTYYHISIWMVLLIAILLNAFGNTTRSYRAAFLQVKESPYIEAARAYGASDLRIIMKYLIPRIFPVIIPQVVTLIPGYVFLEATLAIFGVSTPYAPTWGRIIFDALGQGALHGYYFWVLEPVGLLLITSLAFAMLGYTLDRILNPRLRIG